MLVMRTVRPTVTWVYVSFDIFFRFSSGVRRRPRPKKTPSFVAYPKEGEGAHHQRASSTQETNCIQRQWQQSKASAAFELRGVFIERDRTRW